MVTMGAFLHRHLPGIVLLWSGGSFLMLLAELLWTGHTEGAQALGVLGALLGAAGTGLGLLGPRVLALGLLLGVGFLGVLGLGFHWKEAWEGNRTGEVLLVSDDEEEEFEPEEREEAGPPPLAPLGLSGPALLAAIATLARENGHADPLGRG